MARVSHPRRFHASKWNTRLARRFSCGWSVSTRRGPARHSRIEAGIPFWWMACSTRAARQTSSPPIGCSATARCRAHSCTWGTDRRSRSHGNSGSRICDGQGTDSLGRSAIYSGSEYGEQGSGEEGKREEGRGKREGIPADTPPDVTYKLLSLV